MRSETTVLKVKLQDSINATKHWMIKAQKLEAEIIDLRSQLNSTKDKAHAAA